MKKVKYLIMLLVLAIISTGCVKFNANMDIKKDKSMEFSIIYALDKSIFGEENGLKKEQFKEIEEAGFTVKEYQDGNMVGFTMTKKFANIDELSTESDVEYSISGMMEGTSDNKYMFKVVKGEDKNTYYAKFKFDANSSGLSMDDTEEEDFPDEEDDSILSLDDDSSLDYSSLTSSMDLKFNVTLPNSAISSNATKKEDNNKKLIWELTSSGEQYIEFSFDLSNHVSNNTILYIGIAAGVLVLGAVLFVVLKKKKPNPVAPQKETV